VFGLAHARFSRAKDRRAEAIVARDNNKTGDHDDDGGGGDQGRTSPGQQRTKVHRPGQIAPAPPMTKPKRARRNGSAPTMVFQRVERLAKVYDRFNFHYSLPHVRACVRLVPLPLLLLLPPPPPRLLLLRRRLLLLLPPPLLLLLAPAPPPNHQHHDHQHHHHPAARCPKKRGQ
jgi:hypothetical protein